METTYHVLCYDSDSGRETFKGTVQAETPEDALAMVDAGFGVTYTEAQVRLGGITGPMVKSYGELR